VITKGNDVMGWVTVAKDGNKKEELVKKGFRKCTQIT
jgi:hypothetical protein